ncbi:MAG: trypsin-like peptidase domain-containing protein [Gammaproteobacteria bacterium]|nr:trypsin-like peptidase domain-containing protein [Gammaproteobacteria bacterium]
MNVKPVTFTLIAVAAGLAAALLTLNLDQFPHPGRFGRSGEEQRLPLPQGPVSYAAAVQAAQPSVVNIYTTKVTLEQGASMLDNALLKRFFGDRFSSQPEERLQTSLGSGVIISEQGYILTNHHVVKEADEIRVVLADGESHEARIAGSDPDTDLALIKTDQEGLPAITVGDSRNLRVGDVVLAIGNPFGVGQTVTMGIVGATGRNHLGINTFENFIQTDAAINPGNSGGALINAYGELVGINTAIFSKTGGSQGIGFAIPVTLAKGVMEQILSRGRVIRGWLGIAGRDMTPELATKYQLRESRGVLVTGVLEGGPADRAGLEPGDVITHINNRVPGSTYDILSIISELPPGTQVEIRGARGSETLRLQATVSERPRVDG